MTDQWRAVQIGDDQPVAEVPDPRVVDISERAARTASPSADASGFPRPRTSAGMQESPRTEARRGFLRRAVGYLAADTGVRQFVDLGSRLPSGEGIGRAAREYAPGSRVVYVDAESTAALRRQRAPDGGAPVGVLAVERMDPLPLLEALAGRGHIDFAAPVGVLITDTTALRRDGVLVRELVRALYARMGPGGHVAIAQPAAEPPGTGGRESAAAVFEPFTLIEPGLADMAWWPYPDEEVSAEPTGILAGLGRRG